MVPRMTRIPTACSFFALFAAVACSSGGDTGGGFGPGEPRGPGDFADFAEAEGIARGFEDALSTAAPTARADFPASGTAGYDGVMGFARQQDDDPSVIGRLALDVDFATRAFSGRATDFVTDQGAFLPGEVTLSNGTIDPAATEPLRVRVAGTIGGDGGSLVFDTPATGSVLGPQGELLQGAFGFDDGSDDWEGFFAARAE